MIAGFHAPDGIVGDMGGGSLELVDVKGFEVGEGVTMPLGGLALQDLSGGSLKKAQKIIRSALARAPEYLENLHGRTFYAVGGTWRALARLHQAARDYPLHVMHNYIIDPDDGLDFLRLVEGADSKTLKDIESVSEARRPLLAYGAIVLEEIIRLGEPKEVAVSAFGVREGVLFDRLDPETRERDPLLAAASDLNFLRSRSPRHDPLTLRPPRFRSCLRSWVRPRSLPSRPSRLRSHRSVRLGPQIRQVRPCRPDWSLQTRRRTEMGPQFRRLKRASSREGTRTRGNRPEASHDGTAGRGVMHLGTI